MGQPLLISDCRAMGLVDERASLSWLCAPRVDQPAIVSGLLDPARGGGVEVVIENAEPAGQRHVEGTLVVETDLRSPEGLVRVTDCLLIPPRGPVAVNDPGVLIRQMHVLEGTVRVGILVALRYGFGQHVPRWRRERRSTIAYGPGITVELQTEIPVRPYGPDLGGVAELPAGQRRLMALRWQDPKGVGTDLRKMTEDTAAWWRAWTAPAGGDPRAPLLKGLLYSPTGALVRSATTSAGDGEPAEGRLAWVEDQVAGAAALRGMGLDSDAVMVEQWLERAGEGGPVRGLGGEEPGAETEIAFLSRPVRLGAPAGDARGNIPFVPDLLAPAADSG